MPIHFESARGWRKKAIPALMQAFIPGVGRLKRPRFDIFQCRRVPRSAAFLRRLYSSPAARYKNSPAPAIGIERGLFLLSHDVVERVGEPVI